MVAWLSPRYLAILQHGLPVGGGTHGIEGHNTLVVEQVALAHSTNKGDLQGIGGEEKRSDGSVSSRRQLFPLAESACQGQQEHCSATTPGAFLRVKQRAA